MTIDPQRTSTLRRPRRRWILSLFLGAVILTCGMFIGSALTLGVLWNRWAANIEDLDNLPSRITQRLAQSLDLSEEQKREVEAVVTARYEALSTIRADTYPRVKAELDRARNDIDVILTPEQSKRWRRVFDTLREKLIPPPPGGAGLKGPARMDGMDQHGQSASE